MARHKGPVLVDTNIILECWRTGSWRALTGGYAVETVDDCVMETQTGFQRRRIEQQIDERELRARISAVHGVSPLELAAATLRDGTLSFLDVGERALWAHALTRNDSWVLCGPDAASLRFGVRLGLQRQLMALEALLEDVGYAPKIALRKAYTTGWHKTTLAALITSEGAQRP
jgi:hypothetical protein